MLINQSLSNHSLIKECGVFIKSTSEAHEDFSSSALGSHQGLQSYRLEYRSRTSVLESYELFYTIVMLTTRPTCSSYRVHCLWINQSLSHHNLIKECGVFIKSTSKVPRGFQFMCLGSPKDFSHTALNTHRGLHFFSHTALNTHQGLHF